MGGKHLRRRSAIAAIADSTQHVIAGLTRNITASGRDSVPTSDAASNSVPAPETTSNPVPPLQFRLAGPGQFSGLSKDFLGHQFLDWVCEQRWYSSDARPELWLEGQFLVAGVPKPLVIEFLRAGIAVIQVPIIANGVSGFTDAVTVADGWLALLRIFGIADDAYLAEAISQDVTLAGEQSNSSVFIPNLRLPKAPDGAMLKVLRTLTAGAHPDAEVPRKLSALGYQQVPPVLGTITVSLPDFGPTTLAILTALVPDAADGFQHAWESAHANNSYVELAATLGGTIAELHQALATALPSSELLEPKAYVAALVDRAKAASAAVPQLAQYETQIAKVYDRLAQHLAQPSNSASKLQRIHGDLHLGQVLLDTQSGNWHVIDFEGEPLRPAPERTKPDFRERDIAGLLRSLAYAQATSEKHGGASNANWALDAGAALLAAYQKSQPLDTEVLTALLLDKALYEVLYESRSRPDWLDIPLGAIAELVNFTGLGRTRNDSGLLVLPVMPGLIRHPASMGATVMRSAESPPKTADSLAQAQVSADIPSAPPITRRLSIEQGLPRPEQHANDGQNQHTYSQNQNQPTNYGKVDAMSSATVAPPAPTIDLSAYYSIPEGTAWNPHSVLGGHPFRGPDGSDWAVIRAFRPLADQVDIVTKDGTFSAPHKAAGVFEAVVPAPGGHVPSYRVRTRYGDDVETQDDPYRFLPSLMKGDLHLLHEGRHEELWTKLGANYHKYTDPVLGDTEGTAFAVWAPNAQAVRVIGSFNRWTDTLPMRSMGDSGIWELFVPGVGEGDYYKFEIKGPDGVWRAKADPMAKWAEVPPATASRVFFSKYHWGDDAWMKQRAATNPLDKPVSIYEMHIGSWQVGKSYRELAEILPDYINKLGFTHVEFMPVAEHPYTGSWGYQVTGYFAPTSRFGTPDDFRYLVDKLHQAGIGVIVDWVPAHFPKDEFALARFDGTALYEHPDPRLGEQPDWGTYVFDFGRTEVRNFLVANATYWYEYFHIDGLRVDAVASMLYRDYSRKDGEWFPNVYGGRENLEAIAFLKEANATAYKRTPGVMMIAEESTAFPGVTAPTNRDGLGFGLKWNMGWMNDTLKYMQTDPMYRRYHHGQLTFSLVYAFSEQYVLPISHDEVVHGKGSLINKMPGDRWQQFANLRAFLGYMWTHPGKQLLFMGSEFAQDKEWNEDDGLSWWLMDSPWHGALAHLVADLNKFYKHHAELWQRDFTPDGFEWIDVDDADRNLLAYLRKDKEGNQVAVVVNFAGQPHNNYRLGLPLAGKWREALNTDATEYGGSGMNNGGEITTEKVPQFSQPFSANITVPPLAALIFVPEVARKTTPINDGQTPQNDPAH